MAGMRGTRLGKEGEDSPHVPHPGLRPRLARMEAGSPGLGRTQSTETRVFSLCGSHPRLCWGQTAQMVTSFPGDASAQVLEISLGERGPLQPSRRDQGRSVPVALNLAALSGPLGSLKP